MNVYASSAVEIGDSDGTNNDSRMEISTGLSKASDAGFDYVDDLFTLQ